MPRITIIGDEGGQKVIDAPEGRTLMELIRDNGYDEMLALCGGCCSCATCHVYIDPEHFGLLPSTGQDEDDILDSSDNRNAFSRLACQIPVTQIADGLIATVAPAD